MLDLIFVLTPHAGNNATDDFKSAATEVDNNDIPSKTNVARPLMVFDFALLKRRLHQILPIPSAGIRVDGTNLDDAGHDISQ
jgi:hypothetical protein